VWVIFNLANAHLEDDIFSLANAHVEDVIFNLVMPTLRMLSLIWPMPT
jgi:hypothetical protein